MSEKIKSQMISRREAFFLLGLAAALGFALPAEVLTASDAEAQATAPAPSGGTTGMQRRQARRTGISGVKRGAPAATSGVRSGAEVAKPQKRSNSS
jgi:hypothetical protein